MYILSHIIIVRPKMYETTALGAAMAAGLGAGFWSMNSIKADSDIFSPNLTKDG